MNLKHVNKVIVAAMLLMVAGCGNHEVATNKPAAGSIDDQIKAAQNDPKLAPQAKAMIIGKLQQQQHATPSGSQ